MDYRDGNDGLDGNEIVDKTYAPTTADNQGYKEGDQWYHTKSQTAYDRYAYISGRWRLVFSGSAATSTPTPTPTVDTQAPNLSFTVPASGAVVPVGTQLVLTATATDNVAVTSMRFLNGLGAVLGQGAKNGNTYTLPYTVTTAVALSLVAEASDAAGNVQTATVNITVRAAAQNQLPIANAGSDNSITLPTSQVALAGSGTDADGTITAYSWSAASGNPTSTAFNNSAVAMPTVSGLTVAGAYRFLLTVQDNQGAFSIADEVVITVNPAPLAGAKAQAIFIGNSLVYGTPGSPGNGDYPSQLRALLPADKYGDWVNFGAPGVSALGIYGNIQTEIIGRKDTVNYSMTIVPLPSVINDLAQGRTADQAWQTMKDYALACFNAGIKIWVGTETPNHKEYGTGVAAIEAGRVEINKRIRAHWQSELKCAALVDWAANATIGTFTMPTTDAPEPWDHTIYSDGQHYLPASYAIKAQMAKPAYEAMLAGQTYGVVTPYPTTPVEPPVDASLMTFGTMSEWVTNGNSATSTGSAPFAAYITSAKAIRGVGYIEGTLRTANKQVVIGLTDVSNIASYEETKYPLHIWPPNGVRPFAGNWSNNNYVNIVDGQKFRIGRESDGKVHAYINGTEVAITNGLSVTGDLFMHCTAAEQGAIIEDMKMVGAQLVNR